MAIGMAIRIATRIGIGIGSGASWVLVDPGTFAGPGTELTGERYSNRLCN